MSSEILVKNILLHSYTEKQAQHCLYLFRRLLEGILFEGLHSSENITDSFLVNIKLNVAQEEKKYFIGWSTVFLNDLNQENFPHLLLDVEKKLTNILKVPVWFAYQPDYETEKKLHVFMSGVIKGDFLLSVHVDEGCVGGFVFEYQGTIYDYSIKKMMNNKKEDIKKIIATYES